MISNNPSRFVLASTLLQSIGFNVLRVEPVKISDQRVMTWAKRFYMKGIDKKLTSLSLTCSHLAVWERAVRETDSEWIYVFEDDVMLNTYALPIPQNYFWIRRRAGDRRARSMIERGSRIETVRCLLDDVEKVANLPNHSTVPIIYLGTNASKNQKSPIWQMRGRYIRMCVSLNLHAYAVRRSLAMELRRRLLDWHEKKCSSPKSIFCGPAHMYNTDLDVMVMELHLDTNPCRMDASLHSQPHPPVPALQMRAYFGQGYWTRNHSVLTGNRPLCIDPDSYGIVSQNVSLESRAEQYARQRILGRHPTAKLQSGQLVVSFRERDGSRVIARYPVNGSKVEVTSTERPP